MAAPDWFGGVLAHPGEIDGELWIEPLRRRGAKKSAKFLAPNFAPLRLGGST
jgi:hypothetical protein